MYYVKLNEILPRRNTEGLKDLHDEMQEYAIITEPEPEEELRF